MRGSELWRAIRELYDLLQKEENSESVYQNYFENNPIVFRCLGFSRAISFEKKSGNRLPFDKERNFQPEPDFICANHDDSSITIFELKTPFIDWPTTSRLDGNRRKFKAYIESFLSQTTEYVESISSSVEARDVICSSLEMDLISAYEIIIIAGVNDPSSNAIVKRLLSQRKIPTTIIPFNRLLKILLEEFYRSRPDGESCSGILLICMIRFLTNDACKMERYFV